MLDLNNKYIVNSDIVIRGIGDKYWALNVKDGKQFRLNSTSCSILNAFRDGKTLGAVIDMIVEEYNVEKLTVVNDCEVVIPFAVKKQLLKEVRL